LAIVHEWALKSAIALAALRFPWAIAEAACISSGMAIGRRLLQAWTTLAGG
jgi:hypothetical protein